MQIERKETDAICHTLRGRLSARGLLLVEIHRLIRDVSNIIRDRGGDLTRPAAVRELARLGWRDQVVDEVSFELIRFILENGYPCGMKSDFSGQGPGGEVPPVSVAASWPPRSPHPPSGV
ncbi:MAG: hypothetical protein DRH56_00325 [Deltaproteobacteria bacterium]|nr:MAG: hypothetical protein DRH56_00325 [Deltaproteobacteria bacterium]